VVRLLATHGVLTHPGYFFDFSRESFLVVSLLPPEGIFGGGPGAAGSFTVNGEAVRTQQRITLQPGDHVSLQLPGGGGYGAVEEENSEEVSA